MCSSDLNTGRRFGNTLQNEEAGSSIGKGTPQGEKGPSPVVSDNGVVLLCRVGETFAISIVEFGEVACFGKHAGRAAQMMA